jgi:hypothetical protein
MKPDHVAQFRPIIAGLRPGDSVALDLPYGQWGRRDKYLAINALLYRMFGKDRRKTPLAIRMKTLTSQLPGRQTW